MLDLKPALDEGKLDSRILRDLEQYRNRSMENALTDLLPRSMIPVVLDRLGIAPDLQANALSRQARRGLVELLKGFPLEITGKRPVSEAIITSGGVAVNQVNPKTMESKRQARRGLVELLKGFPLEITGKRPVSEAIITSGGVAVNQVNPKTMESKLAPGLYFAGEILDCDAYTGGFNLQIAWATAFAAATAAANQDKLCAQR